MKVKKEMKLCQTRNIDRIWELREAITPFTDEAEILLKVGDNVYTNVLLTYGSEDGQGYIVLVPEEY